MHRRQLNIARSRQLALHAALMRSHLNPAEAALWALLSRRQLGVMFRRQVVVLGRYIADFLAPSVKLIVEVDGGYHSRRATADARRDEALRRAGYRVVRLPAELVLTAPQQAVALVQRALRAQMSVARRARWPWLGCFNQSSSRFSRLEMSSPRQGELPSLSMTDR